MTVLLALDDLFMLHEEVLPVRLGVPEPAVYLGYALVGAAVAVRYGRAVARTRWPWLVVSAGAFTVMVVVDLLETSLTTGLYLLEDGAKLLGLVTWCAWLVHTGVSTVVRAGRHGAGTTT